MKIESQQAETFSENNIGITSNVYSNEGPLSQMQNESSHKRKRPVLAEVNDFFCRNIAFINIF